MITGIGKVVGSYLILSVTFRSFKEGVVVEDFIKTLIIQQREDAVKVTAG